MNKIVDPGPSPHGWHKLQTALQCGRKVWYYLDDKEKDLPRQMTVPLIRGSLGHLGLAQFFSRLYNEQRGLDPDEYASPEYAIRYSVEQNGYPHWHTDLAINVVREYAAQYRKRWRVVAVEKVLFGRVEGWPYTQRADLIVFDEYLGKYLIVDHKVVTRLPSGSPARYILSGQFLGYGMFGRELWGDQYGGTYINMISAPNKIKEDFTDPELYDFRLIKVEPTPGADPVFRRTLIKANKILDEVREQDITEVPGSFHENICTTQYGRCPHFGRCQWGKDE